MAELTCIYLRNSLSPASQLGNLIHQTMNASYAPAIVASNDDSDEQVENAENSEITSKTTARPLPSHLFHFMGIHFLLAFCEVVLVVPLIKLFEQSLCIFYYSTHDPPGMIDVGGAIPESFCKIVEIQSNLATIRGWKSLLDIVPGAT